MYLAGRVTSQDQFVFKAIIDYTKSRDRSLNIHNNITDRKGISAAVKFLAALVYNWIVLRVNFGLTSYEDLPLALS